MIGLDTNVLVRWLVQDDPVTSPKVNSLIRRLREDEPGFISIVTAVETIWVLERAYRLPSDVLVTAIEALLHTESFVVQHEEAVFKAMIGLKERRIEFSDGLMAALGEAAGCRRTVTFDRRAAQRGAFELL